jgi:Tfp pilus assembly protein PilX
MNDKTATRFAGRERGSSMVFTLLVLFAILSLGVAGLSSAGFGLTLSTNYRTAVQAEQAAESGIVLAVNAINNNGGVVDFTTDVTPTDKWSSLGLSSSHDMGSGYSNVAYTMSPVSAASTTYTYMGAASSTSMWVTNSGQAPGQAQRTVNARLGFLRPFTCGAIDLPNTGIDANFNGNNFGIDGHNYPIGSTTIDNSVPSTLGISTRSQTDVNSILNALGSNQDDNVTGTSVPSQVASVGTCQGPSVTRITTTIVPNIVGQPGVQTNPVDRTNINGNVTLGTTASPQITYFNGDTTIKANGNAQGAGILVVNGSLTIQGTFNFTGLVIVIGSTQIGDNNSGGGGGQTQLTGNASVYGAIWTTDLSLTVGGSAGVRYSDAALRLVSSIPGLTTPNITPQLVNVTTWMQG